MPEKHIISKLTIKKNIMKITNSFETNVGLLFVGAFIVIGSFVCIIRKQNKTFLDSLCNQRMLFVYANDRSIKQIGCFDSYFKEGDTTLYNNHKVILIKKVEE